MVVGVVGGACVCSLDGELPKTLRSRVAVSIFFITKITSGANVYLVTMVIKEESLCK